MIAYQQTDFFLNRWDGRQHQRGPTVSTNITTWNIKNIELTER